MIDYKWIVLGVCSLSAALGLALPADYDLVDLRNKSVKTQLDAMKKDHRLVMFWGLWCGICKKKLRKDLPEMQKKTNLDIITVNMNETDEIDNVIQYVEVKGKVQVPVFREAKGIVAKNLGISASPYWALYRRVKKEGGADEWKLLKSAPGFKKKQILELSGNQSSKKLPSKSAAKAKPKPKG